MAKKQLPTLEAHFWSEDERFAIIANEMYPLLFQDCREHDCYQERLNDFDGYREKFVDLAERLQIAVLARRDSEDDYHMVGLYRIYGVQGYGEPFECSIGDRIAKLKEA